MPALMRDYDMCEEGFLAVLLTSRGYAKILEPPFLPTQLFQTATFPFLP